jgi:hypothetical protein
VRLVDFTDKEAQARFQKLVKEAVDSYFAEHADEGMSDKAAAASQQRCAEAKRGR